MGRVNTFLAVALVGAVLFLLTSPATAARATASHILVKTEEQANDLKAQLADGADFAELAREHSTCPSGKKGGSLGTFSPGQMVKEFNDVVFNVSQSVQIAYPV